MKITAQKLILSLTALFLVIACSNQQTMDSEDSLSPPIRDAATEFFTTEPPTGPSQASVNVMQAPFVLPQGYQIIETSSVKFAIPEEWTYQVSGSSDLLIFKKGEKEIGQTEILGWFDKNTWQGMKPNHSEQTDFMEIEGVVPISGINIHTYKILLTHTKPAAALEPDWEYSETRWYMTVKEQERSYGFYYSSHEVDDLTMKTIASSFRLNLEGEGL
ncbi:hypothetical protein [Paenibacillus sp. SYP-B4298]|uniref:hypothetical protein n=1 Tax=Paenibacillus sp. SYP-B4298 TaxID=2996034 RepID=UPI0022DDFFBA|nr:hypothetical protein [Paenibacillus sp. SYP-B4298]